jgi:hypothetical protein
LGGCQILVIKLFLKLNFKMGIKPMQVRNLSDFTFESFIKTSSSKQTE